MKENERAAQKAPPQKKKETPHEMTAQPMIYIGPGLQHSDLWANKVFAEGIPEEFRDDPILAPLFVAPEQLDAARAEVGATGSLRNVLYRKAAEQQKERR